MTERMGAGIAERGWSLITGGYCGVMEIASRGARERNPDAHIIGVTTDTLSWRGGPNPYVNDERFQRGLIARIGYLMEEADAYVLTWGGIGTLAELFLAWNLVATGWDKPIIAIGAWWPRILDALQAEAEISDKNRMRITVVEDAEHALEELDRCFIATQKK